MKACIARTRSQMARLIAVWALALASLVAAGSTSAATINNGDLIIADSATTGTHRLIRVDFDGNFAEEISVGGLLFRPSSVAVDTSTGDIYTANQLGSTTGTGKVIRLTLSGGGYTQTLVADGRGADGDSTVSGGDFSVTPNGFLRHPRHMAFEPGGTLLAADRGITFDSVTGANGLVRINLADGNSDTNQTLLASGSPFSDPAAVTVAPSGDIFMGDISASSNLFRVSSDGSTVTALESLISGGIGSILGLAVAATDLDGKATTLLAADNTSNLLLRLDLTYTGSAITSITKATISTGTGGNPFSTPTGVAMGLSGEAYVVDASQTGVYRILDVLGTPSTTFLSFSTIGGGVSFATFQGNAIGVFLFEPYVPEPSTALLLSFGGAALLASRRHRGRRS